MAVRLQSLENASSDSRLFLSIREVPALSYPIVGARDPPSALCENQPEEKTGIDISLKSYLKRGRTGAWSQPRGEKGVEGG